MKKLFSLALTFFIISCGSHKSPIAQYQVKVWGNCDFAKSKIESSAKVAGVLEAQWNKDSKLLSLQLDSTKVSIEEVMRGVSASGFDNDYFAGNDYEYEKLPDSCKYERKAQ